ncbi:uncharacterized protein DS421_11g336070 [Arachis hypogaea]|nr:uncharacterized protein DS421_11g336070 [Arachis hypogaea]
MTTCINDGTNKDWRSLKELFTPIGNNLRILIGIITILMHVNSMAMVTLFVKINNYHHMPMSHILNMNLNHTHKPLFTKHLPMTHIHHTTNHPYHFLVTTTSKHYKKKGLWPRFFFATLQKRGQNPNPCPHRDDNTPTKNNEALPSALPLVSCFFASVKNDEALPSALLLASWFFASLKNDEALLFALPPASWFFASVKNDEALPSALPLASCFFASMKNDEALTSDEEKVRNPLVENHPKQFGIRGAEEEEDPQAEVEGSTSFEPVHQDP